MNTIDEIALRVAEKLEPRGRTYSPDHYIEFAHALLAELSKDAPVGWMTTCAGMVPPSISLGRTRGRRCRAFRLPVGFQARFGRGVLAG